MTMIITIQGFRRDFDDPSILMPILDYTDPAVELFKVFAAGYPSTTIETTALHVAESIKVSMEQLAVFSRNDAFKDLVAFIGIKR